MLPFQFPLGHPKCGWDGEFCRSDTGIDEYEKASIATIVVVFFMITSAAVTVFQRYRYTYACN